MKFIFYQNIKTKDTLILILLSTKTYFTFHFIKMIRAPLSLHLCSMHVDISSRKIPWYGKVWSQRINLTFSCQLILNCLKWKVTKLRNFFLVHLKGNYVKIRDCQPLADQGDVIKFKGLEKNTQYKKNNMKI